MILYRYFETEEYADALCSGHVWLTTLEICRTHRPPRRDPEEAQLDYTHEPIHGDGNDATLQTVASRLGIRIGPGSRDIQLSGNRMRNSIRDAYVLSSSLEQSPALQEKFGTYCVRIKGGRHLFSMVSAELSKRMVMGWSLAKRVVYAERKYHHLGDPPGDTGFVKPPRVDGTLYEDECEYRMLWVPRDMTGLTRLALPLPEAAALCERAAPV